MIDNTTSAAEIDVLRAIYAALNRGDIPGFVAHFAEDMVWAEFLESPGGGTYRGLAAVRAHAMEARATWAEGACEPERFIVEGIWRPCLSMCVCG